MSHHTVLSRSTDTDKIEGLKTENFHLKRQLSTVRAENHILKVKVRKLQDDLAKRQKQIYNLVDPKKSSNFRKFISENGATMFLNLKAQKDRLLKDLSEKDVIIKKLQNELQLTKTYGGNERKKMFDIEARFNKTSSFDIHKEKNFLNIDINQFASESTGNMSVKSQSCPSKPDSVRSDGTKSSSDVPKDVSCPQTPVTVIESDDIDQLNYNLQKIKLNALKKRSSESARIQRNVEIVSPYCASYPTPKTTQNTPREASPSRIIPVVIQATPTRPIAPSPVRKNDSPQSDIDRIELQCETPHEEIQQLQTYFLDMLDEVDTLKNTIVKLQCDQRRTNSALVNKESVIGELAEQIESLRSNISVRSISPTKKKRQKGKKSPDKKSTGNASSGSSHKSKFGSRLDLQKYNEYMLEKRPNLDDSSLKTAMSSSCRTRSREGGYKRVGRISKDSSRDKASDTSQLMFVHNYPNNAYKNLSHRGYGY